MSVFDVIARALPKTRALTAPADLMSAEMADVARAQRYMVDGLPALFHGGGGLNPGARRPYVHLTPFEDIAGLYGDVAGPLTVRGPILENKGATLLYGDELDALLRQAAERGATGVRARLFDRGRLGPQEQVVMIDVPAVRHVEVAFDPARLRARDIFAGLAPVGAAGGGAFGALERRTP